MPAGVNRHWSIQPRGPNGSARGSSLRSASPESTRISIACRNSADGRETSIQQDSLCHIVESIARMRRRVESSCSLRSERFIRLPFGGCGPRQRLLVGSEGEWLANQPGADQAAPGWPSEVYFFFLLRLLTSDIRASRISVWVASSVPSVQPKGMELRTFSSLVRRWRLATAAVYRERYRFASASSVLRGRVTASDMPYGGFGLNR